MDILDSILNDMDKPPSMSHEQREKIRKVQEAQKKEQEALKKQLKEFRTHVENEISKFVQDEKQERYTFEPMDNCFRTVIHEVAEVASLPAYSIGEESVDRHVLVCKPNNTPCEDEMAALRRGEEWNADKARELAEKRAREKKEAEESKRKPTTFVPNFNYKQKYEHIIGRESAKDAARKTQTNKQYGFVPSENKKDVRSIEQTLADIQSKKRQKVSHESTTK